MDNDIGYSKNKQKLLKKISQKFIKNKYLFMSLFTMLLFYHIALFDCILPLYEANLVYADNNKHSKRVWLYFIILNSFFALFLISYVRCSFRNPGKYCKEYFDLFSLQRYYEIYNNYYKNLIYTKKSNYQPAPLINANDILNMNFQSQNDKMNNVEYILINI